MKRNKSNNKLSLKKETAVILKFDNYHQTKGGMLLIVDTVIGCQTLVYSCVDTWPTHSRVAYC